MKKTGLTLRASRSPANDPAITALLRSLTGDNATLLASIGTFLQSRGVAPPWAVPASVSLAEFMAAHAARKSKKLSAGAYVLLKRVLTGFVVAHKGSALDAVTGQHLQSWQDGLVAKGLSAGSVRNQMAVLGGAFTRAVALGHLRVNPCVAVEAPESDSEASREPMAQADVDKLMAFLRASSEAEWAIMVELAMFGGLRLLDAARMLCSAVVIEDGACFLHFTPSKTGNPMMVPAFPPLSGTLLPFLARSGPMLPGLAGKSASCLSHRFAGLLAAAGVDPMPVTLKNGRMMNRICFHSLRHSNRVWLAKLGLPPHLSMRLMGHSSASVHDGYLHQRARDLAAQLKPFFAVAA